MLTSTLTPHPSVASTPQAPKSSYQPYKEKTHLAGSITNRGTSAVNAVGTPLGRYEKMIQDAIGSRWYAYVPQRMDLISLGTAQVVFSIDRSGKVKILAGNTTAIVSVPGGIASDSVGLAMVQTNAGVEVQSVVPSVTAGTITIRLNKAPTKAVMVGWSVVS